MATPILLAQLNGTLAYENTGAGGTGSSAGALRWATGHTGANQAAVVEEGTTNTIENPSAEASTGLWSAHPNNTLTRITTDAASGSAAFQLANTGATANTGMYVTNPSDRAAASPGQVWSGQIRGKLVSGAGTMQCNIQEYNGTSFLRSTGGTGVALNGTWQTATLEGLTVGASATNLDISPKIVGNATVTWVVDAIQLEQKDHITSYADGSLGTGYAWAGVANDSDSTRTATTVDLTTALPAEVAVRYSENDGASWAVAFVTAFTGVNVGTYGRLTHTGTALRLASDRRTRFGPVYAFSDTLTGSERAVLTSTQDWTFGMDLSAVATAPVLVIGRPHVGPLIIGKD